MAVRLNVEWLKDWLTEPPFSEPSLVSFANFVLLLASTSVIKLLLLWIIFSPGRFRAISRASPFFLLRRRFFVEYFLGWYHRIWTNDSDLTITSNNFKLICAQIGSTVHLGCASCQLPGQSCTHQAEPQNLSDLDCSPESPRILQGAAKCG